MSTDATLLRWMELRSKEASQELCPSCGHRPVARNPEGFCSACAARKRREDDERERRHRENQQRWAAENNA